MKPAASIAVLLLMSVFAPQISSAPAPQFHAGTPSSAPGDPCQPPAVVASFLNFTPQQTQQFGSLLTQFRTDITALQQQIAPRQQQLDVLLSQANPNPAPIGVLVVQIHALQQQVAQVIQGYQTAFAGLLTPAQQQQVELVAAASQVQPAVGAFVALQLVPAAPQLPCQKP